MVLDDLLEFDSAVYAKRLHDLSTPQLKTREEEKTRKFLSSSCSLGIGTASLAATGGISAIWMGFSTRNMDVAHKKRKLIQAELSRRGVPWKEGVTWQDKKVAVVGGLTTLVVGNAVIDGLDRGGAGGGEVQCVGGAGGTPTFEEVF